MIIDYELLPAGGTALRYRVDTERPISQGDASSPAWTALEYSQCPNCPYAGSHCPAALDVAPLVEALGAVVSHARMRVRVHSAERVIESEADVQTVLSALLGLLLASSGCPILNRLRGLARIHLPFQSLEETQFRLVGAWLLGRLGDAGQGGEAGDAGPLRPDFAELTRLMEAIGDVNYAFMQRLRAAAREDAGINALAMLAAGALNVQVSLDDPLEGLGDYAIR